MKATKSAEEYILSVEQWQAALIKLRDIGLASGLDENIKWGIPVYSHQGKNVMGIAAFKTYVALWFHQGALLEDKQKKLINAQEGTTKALRQWRFNSIEEIDAELIHAYILEAIQNVEQGKEIKATRKDPFEIPVELLAEFDQSQELIKRFYSFTESKQREFANYVNEAKRKETRDQQIEKIIPLILEGIGLNDKYKK